MKVMHSWGMVLVLGFAPVARAQPADETSTTTGASQPENAQAKALREQLAREAAARQAEQQALIDADIARNPDGKNAQEARKAAEAKKALEAVKQSAEEKAQADAAAAAATTAAKAEQDRKDAEAAWKAGAAERAKLEAQKQAAVEKWRKSAKPGPSIMQGRRADGTYTVMVDGKISTFATAAEAQAFVDKVRGSSESTLSY